MNKARVHQSFQVKSGKMKRDSLHQNVKISVILMGKAKSALISGKEKVVRGIWPREVIVE